MTARHGPVVALTRGTFRKRSVRHGVQIGRKAAPRAARRVVRRASNQAIKPAVNKAVSKVVGEIAQMVETIVQTVRKDRLVVTCETKPGICRHGSAASPGNISNK